ncbi:MAG: DoxX family protein [Bacteroidota bacterium]
MTKKSTKIISTVLIAIPALMIVMSGIMKLTGAQQIVEGLGKIGLSRYIVLLGVIELVSVGLLVFPKTIRIGFLLLCCYLGGALSIELAAGEPPVAAIFLIILWVGVFLRNKTMFVEQEIVQ